jgi:hypothetical protein
MRNPLNGSVIVLIMGILDPKCAPPTGSPPELLTPLCHRVDER